MPVRIFEVYCFVKNRFFTALFGILSSFLWVETRDTLGRYGVKHSLLYFQILHPKFRYSFSDQNLEVYYVLYCVDSFMK